MCNYCWANRTHNVNMSLFVAEDATKKISVDTFLDDNELTTIVTDERDWIVVRKAVRVKFCPCCGMRLRQHIFKKVVQTIKDSIRE